MNSHLLLFGKFTEVLPIVQSYPNLSGDSGYIYLFTAYHGYKIKIGKTQKLFKRISAHYANMKLYGTGCIEELGILGPYENVNDAEKQILSMLEDKRTADSKEWFETSIDYVLAKIKDLNHKKVSIFNHCKFESKLKNHYRLFFSDARYKEQDTINVSIYQLHQEFKDVWGERAFKLNTQSLNFMMQNLCQNNNWIKPSNKHDNPSWDIYKNLI